MEDGRWKMEDGKIEDEDEDEDENEDENKNGDD
jgi:hypothetical protein